MTITTKTVEPGIVSVTVNYPPVNAVPSAGWFELADQITLWVRREAGWLVEYYPTTGVRPATAADAARAGRHPADGDLVVTLGVLDPTWLTGLLLRCGRFSDTNFFVD